MAHHASAAQQGAQERAAAVQDVNQMAIIQVYAPTTNAEEAEVNQFYEDLEDLLELIPKQKYVLFITGDWNAKAGSQEIPGVTGKFGLGV